MGSSAQDTQNEIGRLRDDMTAAVREMQRRFQGGLPGVVRSDARFYGNEARTELTAQVRNNPTLVGFVGTIGVAAVGYTAVSAIASWRASRTPAGRARRRARGVSGTIQGRVSESLRNLEQIRRGGVVLKLDPDKAGYVRVTDARLGNPPGTSVKEGGSELVKRLVWALVLTVFMAVGSVVARRLATGFWRATVQEDPPNRS